VARRGLGPGFGTARGPRLFRIDIDRGKVVEGAEVAPAVSELAIVGDEVWAPHDEVFGSRPVIDRYARADPRPKYGQIGLTRHVDLHDFQLFVHGGTSFAWVEALSGSTFELLRVRLE